MRPLHLRFALPFGVFAAAPASAQQAAGDCPYPILFLHGMWEGAWFWEEWLDFFARRGWRGRAVNLRGHGDSRPVEDLGKVRFAEFLEDALGAARELGNPVLVGHSMGGLLVQKMAEMLDPPAVVAVTPAAPRGIFALSTWTIAKMAGLHLHEILLGKVLAPPFEEMQQLLLNRLPPERQREVFEQQQPESGRQTFDVAVVGVPVDAARVTSPLLVVGAEDDRITPAKTVKKIAAKYGAEYREYPEHAHMIVVEPGWETVAQETAEWIESVTALDRVE